MIERQERCGTCKWFVEEVSGDEGEATGCCKRFPPVLSLGEFDRNNWLDERGNDSDVPVRADCSFINWMQPFVIETDFCGEWKSKQTKDDIHDE